jgi:hypothetical protein
VLVKCLKIGQHKCIFWSSCHLVETSFGLVVVWSCWYLASCLLVELSNISVK